MSGPGLASVATRLAGIRQRLNHVASRVGVGHDFQRALVAAERRLGGAETTAEVSNPTTQHSHASHESPAPVAFHAAPTVGMLGTPIKLRADVTAFVGTHVVGSAWAARLPEAGRRWAGPIEQAAARNGLDPRLLAAVVWAESGFRPDAVSRAGATGLTQLMPGTAEGLGVDPLDPIQNLDGGARYLSSMIRRFGSVELGLAAYNAGPGSVDRAGGIPNIAETQAYVPKVLDHYHTLGGAA